MELGISKNPPLRLNITFSRLSEHFEKDKCLLNRRGQRTASSSNRHNTLLRPRVLSTATPLPMPLNHALLSALPVGLALLLIGGTLFSVNSPTSPSTASDTVVTKQIRPLMAGLAQDMSRINTGIWHEDFDLVRQGASSIANHPRIASEQVKKIKKTLGQEFQNFVKFDKSVHSTSKELVSATEARDWSDVLNKYTELRDGCFGCHSAYRERLRPVLTQ